jgi:hypothetical protein
MNESYIGKWFLEDIGIRWESHQWRAFNIGKPKVNCSKDWSTGLGPIDLEEALALFRHSNITIFPVSQQGGGLDR